MLSNMYSIFAFWEIQNGLIKKKRVIAFLRCLLNWGKVIGVLKNWMAFKKKIEMIIFWMMSFNFMTFIYSFVMVYLVILIIFTIIALDNVNVYNNRHSQCKIKSKKKRVILQWNHKCLKLLRWCFMLSDGSYILFIGPENTFSW